MSDESKKESLSETSVERIASEVIEKLGEAQKQQERPSTMREAVAEKHEAMAEVDFTSKYPIPSAIGGFALIVAAVFGVGEWVKPQTGIPLYIACGAGVALFPGMTRRALALISGVSAAAARKKESE